MSIEILVAPNDGWQQWDQDAVDEWFDQNYDGEDVAKNVWWTYFIANIESICGPIEKRWPMLHKFANECVLSSSEAAAFQVELAKLSTELDTIPTHALRKVHFPDDTEITEGEHVTEEQIATAMEKQIMHMRHAIESPTDFVQKYTEEMKPEVATAFILENLIDGLMPKNLAMLFEFPLSSLTEVCERAVVKGTGVLCY